MGGVLTGFAIIAFVIAVGYVAARFDLGGPNAGHVLNRVAYFVTSPALLFTVIARENLAVVFSAPAAVAAIAAVACMLLYGLISRFAFRRPVAETTLGAMGAGYVNANNIGLPVAVYVLGNGSYVAPVLLVQLVVLTPIILTIVDITSSGQVSLRSILLQPVRNPIIIASLAGVVVAATGWHIPDAVLAPFTLLGGAAVPLVLMAFGMSLRGSAPLRAAGSRAEILTGSVIKALVMPALALAVARFGFGVTGPVLFDTVVLAALPTAQNVYNYAARFDRGVVVARDTVLLTTIAAVPVILATALLLA